MLMLGAPSQVAKWPQAGIELDLISLPEDKDQEFIAETTTEVRDEEGKLINIKRDIAKYGQLVGNYCIKGWRGVVDRKKKPLRCTEKNINEFMLIGVAQDFVFGKIKGLSLIVIKESQAAKKD